MKIIKKVNVLLWIIFLVNLGVRLYLSLNTGNFSGGESYFSLRVIENIIGTGFPFYYDVLSFSGRELVYMPLFYYVSVIFNVIPYGLKIFPQVIAASTTFLVYYISFAISKSKTSSLYAALVASFIPIYFELTVNKITPYVLFMLVLLVLFYLLPRLKEKKYVNLFILMSLVLVFTKVYSFIFLLTLIIYSIFIIVEKYNVERIKKETLTFTFFLILIINFLVFKEALIQYGFNLLGYKNYFLTSGLLELIYGLGLPIILLGGLGIYYAIANPNKDEHVIILLSSLISVVILILAKVIELKDGFGFVSIFLGILSVLTIKRIYEYISISKLDHLKKLFSLLIVLFIIGFGVLPSFTSIGYFDDGDIDDLEWMEANSYGKIIIASPVDEGNLITQIAKRKTVVDENFLLAPNPDERVEDMDTAFETWSESAALRIFNKYNASYIYLSENSKEKYNIGRLLYGNDEQCFRRERQSVYKIIC
jgi:hypothetical protein